MLQNNAGLINVWLRIRKKKSVVIFDIIVLFKLSFIPYSYKISRRLLRFSSFNAISNNIIYALFIVIVIETAICVITFHFTIHARKNLFNWFLCELFKNHLYCFLSFSTLHPIIEWDSFERPVFDLGLQCVVFLQYT